MVHRRTHYGSDVHHFLDRCAWGLANVATLEQINTMYDQFTVLKKGSKHGVRIRAELEAGDNYDSESADETFDSEELGGKSMAALMALTLEEVIIIAHRSVGLECSNEEASALAKYETHCYDKNSGGVAQQGNQNMENIIANVTQRITN